MSCRQSLYGCTRDGGICADSPPSSRARWWRLRPHGARQGPVTGWLPGSARERSRVKPDQAGISALRARERRTIASHYGVLGRTKPTFRRKKGRPNMAGGGSHCRWAVATRRVAMVVGGGSGNPSRFLYANTVPIRFAGFLNRCAGYQCMYARLRFNLAMDSR